MKRLTAVFLILGLMICLIPSLGEEQLPTTPEEILAAYPGYEISNGILDPKEPMNKHSKKLYQNGCAIAPGLSLDKNTPFIALILDAGKGNAPNYVTVETEYSVYDFEAIEKAKNGEKTVFMMYDSRFWEMLREINQSAEAVKVTYRSKKNAKGKTFTINEEQRKILRVFYRTWDKMLLDVNNLVNYTATMKMLQGAFDYKLTVRHIKDLPAPTINPDAENYETVKTDKQPADGSGAEGKGSEVSLHAGVKLGMGIREVVQAETDAGNTVYNASPNAKGIKVSPDKADTVQLPWGMLYYYGKLAGGDKNSHAAYKFNDARILTSVQYFIHSSSKKDGKKLYDQIEETLKGKYGEPGASAASKTKLDAGKELSKVASYRDITRIADYSQWLVRQPDGSAILIEHIFQSSSTNGEYNFMNYVIHVESNESQSGSLEDDL